MKHGIDRVYERSYSPNFSLHLDILPKRKKKKKETEVKAFVYSRESWIISSTIDQIMRQNGQTCYSSRSSFPFSKTTKTFFSNGRLSGQGEKKEANRDIVIVPPLSLSLFSRQIYQSPLAELICRMDNLMINDIEKKQNSYPSRVKMVW